MSKKSRRRKQQKRSLNPLIWLMGGGVLLIAAVLFLAFGGGSGGGTPALAVDKQTIDYGDVKLATDLTFEIKVTNTGDGTLRFREEPYIEVREGC
jgi:multidrug efflux pump subunit AcrA (membrane-fusion protein)